MSYLEQKCFFFENTTYTCTCIQFFKSVLGHPIKRYDNRTLMKKSFEVCGFGNHPFVNSSSILFIWFLLLYTTQKKSTGMHRTNFFIKFHTKKLICLFFPFDIHSFYKSNQFFLSFKYIQKIFLKKNENFFQLTLIGLLLIKLKTEKRRHRQYISILFHIK